MNLNQRLTALERLHNPSALHIEIIKDASILNAEQLSSRKQIYIVLEL